LRRRISPSHDYSVGDILVIEVSCTPTTVKVDLAIPGAVQPEAEPAEALI
jgi:hypothetical protein